MKKTPVYIDEIVNIGNVTSSVRSSDNVAKKIGTVGIASASIYVIAIIIFINVFFRVAFSSIVQSDYSSTQDDDVSALQVLETETNLEIYGDEIYLDEISHGIYRICTEQDEYEKHITWDYGAESYYDYESDCYLWYNTDVSPNLWQYWYDDIAGDNYYGWMECEGDDWYIEVSDTEWERYEGDTSWLWHIENSFD